MTSASSQNKDRSATAILVGFYVILIAFSFYGSYKFTDWSAADSLKSFAAVVTVCLTAASAIVGVITSFISLSKNQQAAAELEKLKSHLQVKVFEQKIWTDLRFEHEKMKAAAESTAYAKLSTAIDYSYLLLAKLETSSWRPEDKGLMDSALLEAYSQLVYTRSVEHRTLWEKVRQRARFISEEAEKIKAAEQPDLWKKNVEDFADLGRQFKETANTEMNQYPQRN